MSTERIESVGKEPEKSEKQSVRKYSKYVLTRSVIALVVIVAGVFAVMAFWNSVFHTPQIEDRERAIRSMQEVARLDLGMRFTIHSGMTKTIGSPLLWRVVIAFDSDSVAAFRDTLDVERRILLIVGGLAKYSPADFVFIYTHHKSSFTSEEEVHTYKTEDIRAFMGLPKSSSDSISKLYVN
jgi:hypothetical protein